MNKHLTIILLLLATLSVGFVACDDEKQEYIRPQFGAMTVNPSPAHPGDSVELIVPHKAKGNGIAATSYYWTVQALCTDPVTHQAKDTLMVVQDNYDGYGKRDPRVKFLLPASTAPGTYPVIMRASFSCYIGNVLFDEATVNGRLTVQ